VQEAAFDGLAVSPTCGPQITGGFVIPEHSVFDAEELRRERMVILQEIGQALDTPDDVIFDNFQECAYPDQRLG
jgi:hypothetical protein